MLRTGKVADLPAWIPSAWCNSIQDLKTGFVLL